MKLVTQKGNPDRDPLNCGFAGDCVMRVEHAKGYLCEQCVHFNFLDGFFGSRKAQVLLKWRLFVKLAVDMLV